MSDTPKIPALESDLQAMREWRDELGFRYNRAKIGFKELERENARLNEYIGALEDVCDSDQLRRAQGKQEGER
jgi:hypothetical protein